MEDELTAIVMELRRHFASLYGERLETTYRHFALTNEAEVRAWIQSMLHARTWDALTDIRFV